MMPPGPSCHHLTLIHLSSVTKKYEGKKVVTALELEATAMLTEEERSVLVALLQKVYLKQEEDAE